MKFRSFIVFYLFIYLLPIGATRDKLKLKISSVKLKKACNLKVHIYI